MNIEDIKVGETYNVQVIITSKEKGLTEVEMSAVVADARGKTLSEDVIYFNESDLKAFAPCKPAPKHDPCRLFKAGDVVEYRPKDGRANPNLLVGRRYKVSADEPCDSGIVQVEFDGLRHIDTFVAYNNLELITPVEEIEPHFFFDEDEVRELTVYTIYFGTKRNYELVSSLDKKYYTREQAEAERDRLNAEYRKGQEPYYETDRYGLWKVMKRTHIPNTVREVCTYFDDHPHDKEAAEAECARLNAEYRKEQA